MAALPRSFLKSVELLDLLLHREFTGMKRVRDDYWYTPAVPDPLRCGRLPAGTEDLPPKKYVLARAGQLSDEANGYARILRMVLTRARPLVLLKTQPFGLGPAGKKKSPHY